MQVLKNLVSSQFNRVIVFFSTALAITQPGLVYAAPNPADSWLTFEQVEADVGLAREAYERVHPGYARYTSRTVLDQAWEDIVLKAQANDGMSLGEFYLAVQLVLTEIRCDHTKAELPASLREYRNTHAVYLPFKWEVIENRGFITAVELDYPLTVGDEILTIDSQPLTLLLDQVKPYIPVDGYTEWAKRGGLSQSLEFMGGAVDHFGSLLWQINETATIKIRNKIGETSTVTVQRVTFPRYESIGSNLNSTRNFKDAINFKRIGDNAALLRIDTFVNYREPVNPDDLYRPIFASLREEGRDQSILDLRRNGGGSTDAERRLLAYLIDKPLRTVTEMQVATLDLDGLREHLSTWERGALKPNRIRFRKNAEGSYSLRNWFADELRTLKPAKFSFTGDLFVLTSNDNSSASTNLIAILESHRRVTTIGERTGGSPDGTTAGIIFTLVLPESGTRTRIPVIRYFNNIAGFEAGKGITPNQYIPRTAKAFLRGRDDALLKAIALTGNGSL